MKPKSKAQTPKSEVSWTAPAERSGDGALWGVHNACRTVKILGTSNLFISARSPLRGRKSGVAAALCHRATYYYGEKFVLVKK